MLLFENNHIKSLKLKENQNKSLTSNYSKNKIFIFIIFFCKEIYIKKSIKNTYHIIYLEKENFKKIIEHGNTIYSILK